MTSLDAVPASAPDWLPSMVQVRRSDPVYMAHAYLTKVPVTAIEPFIEAFTEPGDVVLDPFAGSGMTGIAALVMGRRAVLYDVSVLGRHIGSNYVNLVDAKMLDERGEVVLRRALERIGDVYAVTCESCGGEARLAKSVWSAVIECGVCRAPVNYYRCLEDADWHRERMTCPHCGAAASSRCPWPWRRASPCVDPRRRSPARPGPSSARRACPYSITRFWSKKANVWMPVVAVSPTRNASKYSSTWRHTP